MRFSFNAWIEGMKNLSQAQLLQMTVAGQFGATIGLIFATITLLLYGTWQFTLFLIFCIILQFLQWVKAKKDYEMELNRLKADQEMLMEMNTNGTK